MQMFSRFCVFVFLCVSLLYAGGIVDVHAQVASLEVGGDIGVDSVYRVGDRVEVVFFATSGGHHPRGGAELRITHSGLTGVTISNGGTTDVLGEVTVTGTIVDTNVYIQAEWWARDLIARAEPQVIKNVAKQNAEVVFHRYANTFHHPDVREHFPDVLRAFKNPEVQSVLNAVVINHFVRDPEYIRAFYPDIDKSLITLLATDNDFRTLFEDEEFHDVLQDPAEIDELVWVIEAQPPREPGRLTIVSGNFQEGGAQTALRNPLIVLVRDQYGEPLSGVAVAFRVTRGDGRLSRTRAQTNSTGRAETTLTLASGGIHQVEASVVGFPSLTQTFTAAAAVCEVPTPSVPEPPRATTLSIVSGNNQSGEVGKPLAEPFVVNVRDQDGKLLGGVTVTFTVTAGGGRLSIPTEREIGSEGQVQMNFTLGVNPGISQIEARVAATDSLNGTPLTQTFTATAIGAAPPEPTTLNILSGNNQTGEAGKPLAQPFVVRVRDNTGRLLPGIGVIFTVTGGDGSLSDETAITDERGEAEATLTLGALPGENRVKVEVASFPSATRYFTAIAIAPPVASNPVPTSIPVVYWIEGGAIFQFDGGSKQALVEPSTDWTVTSLAMDMEKNKLYWTERQTGKQMGRIWSGDLNDRNARELQSITAVPEGIVVDAENGKLYWTNDRGKIQSINVNGKNFNGNFIASLGSPHHIALDLDGNTAWGDIYWTVANEDGSWSIWSAPLDGNVKKVIMSDLGKLGGIAVDGDKLYWTEEVEENHGKISSAYKNGSGNKTLFSLPGSVPLGLAVDEARHRLYWTDNGGNIQSLNLDKPIETEIVVEGLDAPAVAIALGRSSEAVPAGPAAPSTIVERSVESALLANYPNPFNPETWIPYQLSEPADVSVSIYSVNGHLVRRLDLGHRVAGVYRSRSRAAYWDGRNAFGERVASGLYFYTFTAGDFTATRKMLIRK